MLQLVWFKRDLRASDHQALAQAARQGPVIAFYCFEPEYWQLIDTSLRQWLFIEESLYDLNQQLNQKLVISVGKVTDFLNQVQQHFGIFRLHSHEETGNYWTYQRDIAVKHWCQQQQIDWHEYSQFGVCRPNPGRDHWAENWHQFIHAEVADLPIIKWQQHDLPTTPALKELSAYVTDQQPCPGRQPGGRQQALALLNSFLTHRGEFYRSSISSPLSAEQACSRLSPYLAYGCISLKELYRILNEARHYYRHQPEKKTYWNNSLKAFESRLWWHCHFIQKLEDEPEMEWKNLHPAYNHLRQHHHPERLQAWQQGNTGWPLVDACMRYLQHHGWLNFRMRAMLVSIASYALWLPWQLTAPFLARLFVDYEPGIHYPQVQMQSGTTGINIPRMYNPVLQAQKQDPNGQFIRRWIPELRQVPNSWIHQPGLMPASLKTQYQCESYPDPIVDFNNATRQAKQAISDIRQHDFYQQARDIGHKHGSRKRSGSRKASRRKKEKAADSQQLSLF
ncbi:deoxyribodipyrimidine photo-lyase/cryptochrome family protein [Bacterioplanoides sp.]|uniref:cryptochrome/deoxyribodipyrimidine photo-lyase family protein n=1 Tax=Bacterioplanoides sp. TaxID=2066072 RepID=UPI003AFF99FB